MNIKYIIIIISSILFFTIYGFFVVKTKLSGDGSYHMQYVKQNYERNDLTHLHDYLYGHYGYPRIQQFSLNYPPLYHLIGTLFYKEFGEKSLYIIDGIFIFILLINVLAFYKYKRFEYIILLFFISGWYVAGGNNNIFLLLGSGLLYLIGGRVLNFDKKEINSNYISYALVLSIFTTLGMGSKQSFYFLVPFFFLYLIFFCKKYKKLIIYYIVFSIILVSPLLFRQIRNTGTLSTQTISGWPFIDKYVFSPRHFDFDVWQKEIDQIVDIDSLDRLSSTYYHSINQGLLDFKDFRRFFNNLQLSSYSNLPFIWKGYVSYLTLLFTIFILGCVYIYSNKKDFFYFFSFFIGSIIVYYFTSKIEYSLILGLLIYFVQEKGYASIKNKNNLLVFFSILLTIFLVHTIGYVKKQSNFLQITYSRSKLIDELSYDDLKEELKFIAQNDTDLIMHSNSQEFPYENQVRTFWDFRIFFLNSIELEKYMPFYIGYGFKYIVIPKMTISGKFNNRNIFYSESDFAKLVFGEIGFKLLYENEDFFIYEVDTNFWK